jgi:hypothetical protein
MGLYYSDDERFVINTMDYPPSTYLSEKGIADSIAATVIQQWWRHLQNPVEDDTMIVVSELNLDVVNSDLEVEYDSDSGCESDCESNSADCDSDSESDLEPNPQPSCFDEIFDFINTIFFY